MGIFNIGGALVNSYQFKLFYYMQIIMPPDEIRNWIETRRGSYLFKLT